MRVSKTSLLTVVLLAGPATVGPLAPPAVLAQGSGDGLAHIAFGPMPFGCNTDAFETRPDYAMLYQTPASWAEVSTHADTIELYVMMLLWHQAGHPAYDLDSFVSTLRAAGKRVSFQTGSIPGPLQVGTACPAGAGVTGADTDWGYLQTWLQADGGRGVVHEIVLDNAYGRFLNICKGAQLSDAARVAYATNEMAAYLLQISNRLPGVKLALTDAIDPFSFVGLDGEYYPPTVDPPISGLPAVSYADFLGQLNSAAVARNVVIDRIVIDFMHAIEFDHSQHPAERDIRAAHTQPPGPPWRVGVYFNAFPAAVAQDCARPPDPPLPPPTPAQRAAVKNRSVRFLVDYGLMGGAPEVMHLQFWHRIPDWTGPETLDLSALNIFREQLRESRTRREHVGFYAPSGGQFFLTQTQLDGPPVVERTFGNAGWQPVVGDWNNDGVRTLGAYNGATAQFYLASSNGADPAVTYVVYGPAGAGWVPLSGDWNGSAQGLGDDTIGLYDPANSTFYLRDSNTTGYADYTFVYGSAGQNYIPLSGDWNGDGRDGVGLYHAASRTFFLKNALTTGYADYTYTIPLDGTLVPVVGDWDGNGTDTVGVLRTPPSGGPTMAHLWNGPPDGAAASVFTVAPPADPSWWAFAGRWR
jgi:hypothetical protein